MQATAHVARYCTHACRWVRALNSCSVGLWTVSVGLQGSFGRLTGFWVQEAGLQLLEHVYVCGRVSAAALAVPQSLV